MIKTPPLIGCFLILFLTGGKRISGEEPNAAVLWKNPAPTLNQQILEDGTALLLTKEGVQKAQLKRIKPDFTVETLETPKGVNQVFLDPERERITAAVDWTWKKATVWSGPDLFDADPIELEMDSEMTGAHCRQTQDGALWFLAAQGNIHRLHENKVTSWNAKDLMLKQQKNKRFEHRLDLCESPDGQVLIYPQITIHDQFSPPEGVLLWKNGELQHLAINHDRIGFVEFLDETQLLIGSSRGLEIWNIEKRAVTTEIPFPEELRQWDARPFQSHLLGDGTRLLFFCRQGGTRFPSGGYTQLAELQDGKWTLVPHRVDSHKRSPYRWVRKVEESDRGEIWTHSNGEGLVRRHPDGQWVTYDWRAKIPQNHFRDLHFQNGYLWANGIVFDPAKLDAERKTADPKWEQLVLELPPIRAADGTFYFLDSQAGGTLNIIRQDGAKDIIPLPEQDREQPGSIAPDTVRLIMLDSKHNVWLMGGLGILVWDGTEWTFFGRAASESWPHMRRGRTPFQEALNHFTTKHPKLLLPTGKQHRSTLNDYMFDWFAPVHGENGEMAYYAYLDRLYVFEDDVWRKPGRSGNPDAKRIAGQPQFEGDHLVVEFENGWFRSPLSAWKTEEPIPWEKLDRPLPLHAKSFSRKDIYSPTLPKRLPFPSHKIGRRFSSGSGYWLLMKTGTAHRIIGNYWQQVNLENTPLYQEENFYPVYDLADGTMLFALDGPGNRSNDRYALFSPGVLRSNLIKKDLGVYPTRNVTLQPDYDIEDPSPGILMRQIQLNDGIWQDHPLTSPFELGPLDPGVHTLHIQYFNTQDFRKSKVMTFTFETTFRLKHELKTLSAELGADAFATRNAAEKKLFDLGADALDTLKTLRNHEDPEVRMRAERVIQAIESAAQP